MTRQFDTATLDGAAKHYAGLFLNDSGELNAAWVMGQFYNFTFKDEFAYLVAAMQDRVSFTASMSAVGHNADMIR